jgi:hypothetical protein
MLRIFTKCSISNLIPFSRYSSVLSCHEELLTLNSSASLSDSVCDISDAFHAEKTGGISIMDARQRHLDDPSLPVKVRQEVPPPSGGLRARKIDRSFRGYVVLAGDAFEIKSNSGCLMGAF